MDIVGDTLVSLGKVTRKYVEGGEHLVDLELSNENGRAGVTATGNRHRVAAFSGRWRLTR